jgi:hypothetical protein
MRSLKKKSDVIPAAMRQRLEALRHALLRLHKLLLDDERVAYERVHGRISPAQMLQMLVNDQAFAWLRQISELIVRIDELLEAEDPEGDGSTLIAAARSLLVAEETGSELQRKYYEVLQRSPAAVLQHRELRSIFSSGG